ncbi:MAG: membrane fusion protein (multidrug efflux system) [Gammaproteobacteria bacterium]|jgi:membrane fusion protein (multidrug efflux system)
MNKTISRQMIKTIITNHIPISVRSGQTGKLSVAILLASVWLPAANAQEQFDCLLEPSMVVNISSPQPGIIDQINVDRGDPVKPEMKLARLQSKVEQASVELALARVKLAEKRNQRSEELLKEKFISVNEKDEMVLQEMVAKVEYRQAKEILNRLTIRSPVRGVVVSRFMAPGEYVDGTKILQIAQIDPINVEVIVPTAIARKLQKGGISVIYPEDFSGKYIHAKISVLDSVVDASSSTMGVRLTLPNPGNNIRAGLRCKILFK